MKHFKNSNNYGQTMMRMYSLSILIYILGDRVYGDIAFKGVLKITNTTTWFY
jgi:hypothetical protein